MATQERSSSPLPPLLPTQPGSGPMARRQTSPPLKKDYSLPTSFLALLSAPLASTIDSLIPHTPHTLTSPVTAPVTPAPFLQALVNVPDTQTDKGAAAFSSSHAPLVDLFFDFTPGVEAEHLFDLLGKAWNQDAVSTLKVIFHARSIHEGKGYKDGAFRALAWVWEKHPRTLLANLHLLVDETCARPRSKKRDAEKAMNAEQAIKKVKTGDNGDRTMEVLMLDEDGEVVDEEVKPEYPPRPHGSFNDLIALLLFHVNGQFHTSYTGELDGTHNLGSPGDAKLFKQAREDQKANGGRISRLPTARASKRVNRVEKEKVLGEEKSFMTQVKNSNTQGRKLHLLRERLVQSLEDPKFRALYLAVVDLFATQIEQDLANLAGHERFLLLPDDDRKPFAKGQSPYLFKLSYAAKWVPTPAHGADKQLLFATALAHRLFPQSDHQTGRIQLQKTVLTRLRKAVKVPEVNMVQGPWKVDYSRVPARSMSRNLDSFFEHDPKGVMQYMDRVAAGKSTVAGASMMPHELLIDAMHFKPLASHLANYQWKALVESIASSSRSQLSNCLAVADVSGSMGYLYSTDKKQPTPMTTCIALTLLLCDLAEAPWNGTFITFSSEPTLQHIDADLSLREKATQLSQADWNMSTDFYKVFDLILAAAERAKLAPENMVKRIFVFSDMQFDAAANGSYGETEHRTLVQRFASAGYELPEIVYWNLNGAGNTSKPVLADTPGVSLVSGFSGSLMKYFLGESEDELKEEGVTAEENKGWHVMGRGSDDGMDEDRMEEETVEREKKNPLETVRAIIAASCFNGVQVVD
ncbi:hypothetical protein P7C73_g2568, partial [Tremellales sp. Uapishka_1]